MICAFFGCETLVSPKDVKALKDKNYLLRVFNLFGKAKALHPMIA